MLDNGVVRDGESLLASHVDVGRDHDLMGSHIEPGGSGAGRGRQLSGSTETSQLFQKEERLGVDVAPPCPLARLAQS